MEKMEDGNNKIAINSSAMVNQSIIESMTLEGVQKVLNKINAFHAIVKGTLIPDVDYGIIQGTTKPMLFKSGAENILMLFGLSPTIEILAATPAKLDRDTNFVSYTVKCRLVKNDSVVSEGIGTCNSCERKYAKAEALDIANTIMKMAGKRALVDAVLHVASLSAVFAHDAEDMTEYLKKEAMDNLGVEDASKLKITFGKHKGKTCGEVYKQHYDYVQWFFENGKDEKVRKAFEVLSEAIKLRNEAAMNMKNAVKRDSPGEVDESTGEITNGENLVGEEG